MVQATKNTSYYIDVNKPYGQYGAILSNQPTHLIVKTNNSTKQKFEQRSQAQSIMLEINLNDYLDKKQLDSLKVTVYHGSDAKDQKKQKWEI